MDGVKTYEYGCKTYCLLEDVKKKKLNDSYFVGCKSMRKCVQRHKIPSNKVVFMKNGKIYDCDYKLADVYVERKYVMKHIINVKDDAIGEVKLTDLQKTIEIERKNMEIKLQALQLQLKQKELELKEKDVIYLNKINELYMHIIH